MSAPKRKPSPEIASVAVYDGQAHAGIVLERADGQYEAIPATGESLGLFNTRQGAARALLVARRADDATGGAT